MAKNKTIKVENFEIVLYSQNNGDFISLTDMARYRDEEDYANIEQLVVLSNMESINAVFIRQGLTQSVRLMQLNKIAITQMTSLMNSRQLKRLKKQEIVKIDVCFQNA